VDARDKLIQGLYRRLYMEKKAFEVYRPAEYRRLVDLLECDRPGVMLLSGQYHEFRKEELVRLSDDIPWFLRSFTRLPFFFIYRRISGIGVYRLAGPDRWAARVLHQLLHGDFSGEIWELSSSDMRRLLSRYKSLIIISLDVSGI
jgi:uncharacterized protein (UPF0216 family)